MSQMMLYSAVVVGWQSSTYFISDCRISVSCGDRIEEEVEEVAEVEEGDEDEEEPGNVENIEVAC